LYFVLEAAGLAIADPSAMHEISRPDSDQSRAVYALFVSRKR